MSRLQKNLDDQGHLRNALSNALLHAHWHLEVLDVVGSTHAPAWITGGFVRNCIWDLVFDLDCISRPRDVDVAFFEAATRSESREKGIEDELRKRAPGINWSVRDQGRMHLPAGDPPYGSLERALRAFPDRSSAIAVRLNGKRVEILAPFGLGDAFGGLVRPTPMGLTDGRFQRFIARKLPTWKARWPGVQVALEQAREQADPPQPMVQIPSGKGD